MLGRQPCLGRNMQNYSTAMHREHLCIWLEKVVGLFNLTKHEDCLCPFCAAVKSGKHVITARRKTTVFICRVGSGPSGHLKSYSGYQIRRRQMLHASKLQPNDSTLARLYSVQPEAFSTTAPRGSYANHIYVTFPVSTVSRACIKYLAWRTETVLGSFMIH